MRTTQLPHASCVCQRQCGHIDDACTFSYVGASAVLPGTDCSSQIWHHCRLHAHVGMEAADTRPLHEHPGCTCTLRDHLETYMPKMAAAHVAAHMRLQCLARVSQQASSSNPHAPAPSSTSPVNHPPIKICPSPPLPINRKQVRINELPLPSLGSVAKLLCKVCKARSRRAAVNDTCHNHQAYQRPLMQCPLTLEFTDPSVELAYDATLVPGASVFVNALCCLVILIVSTSLLSLLAAAPALSNSYPADSLSIYSMEAYTRHIRLWNTLCFNARAVLCIVLHSSNLPVPSFAPASLFCLPLLTPMKHSRNLQMIVPQVSAVAFCHLQSAGGVLPARGCMWPVVGAGKHVPAAVHAWLPGTGNGSTIKAAPAAATATAACWYWCSTQVHTHTAARQPTLHPSRAAGGSVHAGGAPRAARHTAGSRSAAQLRPGHLWPAGLDGL